MKPSVTPSERPLVVFVSSVMHSGLDWARDETAHTIDRYSFATRWLFEFTPASSEVVDDSYLQKVREADIVIWLVGEDTTGPVQNEIREALANNRRLWVIRLPVSEHNKPTKALLNEIGLRAKYMDVTETCTLQEAIGLTFGDEVVRALRREPSLGRIAQLEEIWRASIARCIELWQGADVPQADAIEYANNQMIGVPSPDVQPRIGSVLLLLAEQGAGKTLTSERLYQNAIMHIRDNVDAPVPIYLSAREALGQLQRVVEEKANDIGNPHIQGATVIIDGADTVSISSSSELLREARILARTLPNTSIIITSRPTPALSEAEEAINIPLLSEGESFDIISRVAGEQLAHDIQFNLTASLREAIQRPLFAVLLGTHLKKVGRVPNSTVEMVESLVKRSIGRANIDEVSADRLFQRLASLSVDRDGSSVPKHEIGDGSAVAALLNSRLVVEHIGLLSFPLQIWTDWFASQSLISGHPSTVDLVSSQERLERWKDSLITFVGLASPENVSRVLISIAQQYPGFASEIVHKGQASWTQREETSLPPASEWSDQLRTSMQAWVTGIGSQLAQLIAPVRNDGVLLPLGAGTDHTERPFTSWHVGSELSNDGVILLSNSDLVAPEPYWTGRNVHKPANVPAWTWQCTLDELSSNLTPWIKHHSLPVHDGPLMRESAWRTARALLNNRNMREEEYRTEINGTRTLVSTTFIGGSLNQTPIPIVELEGPLASLHGLNYFIGTSLSGGGQEKYNLNHLRMELQNLRNEGKSELLEPWPVADHDYRATQYRQVWELYSDERLLARVIAIYQDALDAYQQLVNTLFSRLAPLMYHAVLLPARLVGIVGVTHRGKDEPLGFQDSPDIGWYLDPLPYGSQCSVDLTLDTRDNVHSFISDESYWASMREKISRLRPYADSWLYASRTNSVLDIFMQEPIVSDIVYDWLRNDLSRIAWIKH